MGKYEKKKEKKSKKGLIITIVVIIVLALLALFVMPQVLYLINGDDSGEMSEVATEAPSDASTETAEDPSDETEPQADYSADDKLAFPLILEEGSLEVESIFAFSGINPDGGLQDATDVASMTLKNTSDRYLESAFITVMLNDGTQCGFTVTDLPAGKSAMAFATGNESFAKDAFCVDLSAEVVFTDTPTWDQLSVSMVGTTVTVQNLSDEDLSEIDVYCHDSFGESYFGGITYKHTINELPAGQAATVDISDSIMGMVEVVRIAINE